MTLQRARSDRRFSAAIGAVVLTISLVGIACYPGSVSNVAELDTVITFRADDTTFYQKFSTYVLVDSVVEFVPGDSVCGPGIVIPGTCVQPSTTIPRTRSFSGPTGPKSRRPGSSRPRGWPTRVPSSSWGSRHAAIPPFGSRGRFTPDGATRGGARGGAGDGIGHPPGASASPTKGPW